MEGKLILPVGMAVRSVGHQTGDVSWVDYDTIKGQIGRIHTNHENGAVRFTEADDPPQARVYQVNFPTEARMLNSFVCCDIAIEPVD